MKTVTSLTAREILDSRGNPTVEADIVLDGGAKGRASVPSGASTGSHEAVELRDGELRYGGKGVQRAVRHIREVIGPKIIGGSFDQRSLDTTLISLDGSDNKANLGANALLAVSLAFSRASATHDTVSLHEYFHSVSGTSEKPILPVPLINILNGGKHALHSTDIQEFMIVPVGAPTFAEALRYGTEVFHSLKKILTERGLSTAVGDEGGFAVPLSSNREALELLMMAIEKAKLVPGKDVSLAIDAASSELFANGVYDLASENRKLTSDEMIAVYAEWAKAFPLISIEDGLAEDDWAGYAAMTEALGKSVQIVGDDLFVTNVTRLKEGIEKKAANAILIKLNQIGTVSETIDAVTMARSNGYASIISHRSGETEDATIADFAVGLATGQIKTGSTSRGERTAKYNQLLRIEESLGTNAEYFGTRMLKQ